MSKPAFYPTILDNELGLYKKPILPLEVDNMDRENFGIYTVFDRVAQEAGPLFVAVNDGVAVRSYKQLKTDNPEDFKLMCVGTFNRVTMIMVPEVTPREVEVL